MAKGCFVVNANTDQVRYDANAGSINWGTGFSACGWHKATGSDAGYLPVFWGTMSNSDFFAYGQASAFGSWQLASNVLTDASGGGPGVDEWFFWAVSVIENSASGMRGRAWDDAGTLLKDQTISTVTWATGHSCNYVEVCTQPNFTSSKLGKSAQVRMWDGVLSQAEFEAELASSTPVKTSGLINACEDDPSVDVSGNADPWDSIVSIDISAADYPPNYVDAPITDAPETLRVVHSGVRYRG